MIQLYRTTKHSFSCCVWLRRHFVCCKWGYHDMMWHHSSLPSPSTLGTNQTTKPPVSITEQFHNKIMILKGTGQGQVGVRKFICIQELYHYRDDKQSVTAEVWHATKINMKYDNKVTACIQAHTHPTSVTIQWTNQPTNHPEMKMVPASILIPVVTWLICSATSSLDDELVVASSTLIPLSVSDEAEKTWWELTWLQLCIYKSFFIALQHFVLTQTSEKC